MLWGGEDESSCQTCTRDLDMRHVPPTAMKRKKWRLSVCLSSFVSLLLLDSEQEVPPGTTESAQSVDYYCDSEFSHDPLTFMLKVDLPAPLHF
jgi:hypothetical protein